MLHSRAARVAGGGGSSSARPICLSAVDWPPLQAFVCLLEPASCVARATIIFNEHSLIHPSSFTWIFTRRARSLSRDSFAHAHRLPKLIAAASWVGGRANSWHSSALRRLFAHFLPATRPLRIPPAHSQPASQPADNSIKASCRLTGSRPALELEARHGAKPDTERRVH